MLATGISVTEIAHIQFIIMYAGYPVIWGSRLQTEVVLSTTESEYIALIQSLQERINIMQLLKDANEVFPLNMLMPKIHCKT